MGCTVCGSNANCGCSSSNSSSSYDRCTSCSSYNCNGSCSSIAGSCSGNSVPATPQPFYACAPACKEDNKQKIFITHFSAALKVVNSWNVPACGQTATLSIPGLTSVVIGSYLWNEEYGYFEVTAFDSGLQQVTVVNRCNEGNAAPGTGVDSCTLFVNTTPPADTSDTGQPCVAVSFTAQAIGACIDITLTNVSGIVAGNEVQIGSGFYRVSEVKPNNIITICNDGEGITPGTSVIATDAAGNYQYCLTILSVSPCEREPIDTAGKLVVCDSEGLTTTLFAQQDAWAVISTAGGGAGTVPGDPGIFCNRLEAPLNIVSGTASYTITVTDATGWDTNDILILAGYPNSAGIPTTRLDVTSIVNATQVQVTITPTPAANVVIPVNTQICSIPCCEVINNRIDEIVCDPEVFRLNINSFVYNVPVTLNVDGYFEDVVDAAVIPVNIAGATCLDGYYAVKAHLSIASNANFAMSPVDLSELGTIYHEIEANWTVGGVNGRADGKIVYTDVLGDTRALGGFPAAPEATFNILPSPAPNFPLNYHQNDVTALAILPPGTTATTLGLSYRTLVGDFETIGLSSFTSMDILISGWVEIYKING